jgi:hypothetical protein
MRRLAAFLGIVFAALLGGAIYVSAQPTGGTAPPFPWNPARYKDAPGPPSGFPEMESWGGSGRFSWGDFDSRTSSARLSLDVGAGPAFGPERNPLNAVLRLGPWSNGARRVGIELSPGPAPWRPETRYYPSDVVTVALDSLPVTAYSPAATCVSGTVEPIARAAQTTGMPIGWHPYHRYELENRVVLRAATPGSGCGGAGCRYRVTTAGWTAGWTGGGYWQPAATYCTTIGCAVNDGSVVLQAEADPTPEGVTDGSCTWNSASDPMWNVPGAAVGLYSTDETFRNHLTSRNADNSAGALLASGATINGPPTENPQPSFATYVPEPRSPCSGPGTSSRTRAARSRWCPPTG